VMPSPSKTAPLPEHLRKYWGNRTEDPRTKPNFCAKQSHLTPSIPWHNGTKKCLACGRAK
jgi:hypothetical protein